MAALAPRNRLNNSILGGYPAISSPSRCDVNLILPPLDADGVAVSEAAEGSGDGDAGEDGG